jgi:glutamate dehydrogenase (NAD(P)+)
LLNIEDKIKIAFNKTITTAINYKTDWRTAAYIVAITRIEQTYKERGIFP